jgi:tRNA 2-thiouridine synthesizing protein E
MEYVVDGKNIEADKNGYLVNQDEWTREVAEAIAKDEGVTLNQRAWDIIDYLRDEFFNNNGNQPNERHMVKHFKEFWSDDALEAKTLYECFPRGPAKQASKIAGLPETKRKGGY